MNPKKGKGRQEDVVVNMAPDSDLPQGRGNFEPPPSPLGRRPESQAWNASRNGVSRAFSNYKLLLSTSFKRLDRLQQEELIGRFCIVLTVGVSILAVLMVYNMIPRALRLIALPAMLFGAWWVAKNVVRPVVIARLEPLLNPPAPIDTTDDPES